MISEDRYERYIKARIGQLYEAISAVKATIVLHKYVPGLDDVCLYRLEAATRDLQSICLRLEAQNNERDC